MLIIVKHLEVASKIYEKCDVIPNNYKNLVKKKAQKRNWAF